MDIGVYICPKTRETKTKRQVFFFDFLVGFEGFCWWCFFSSFFLNITCGGLFEPTCSIWGCDPRCVSSLWIQRFLMGESGTGKKVERGILISLTIHVCYICLHLVDFYMDAMGIATTSIGSNSNPLPSPSSPAP